jgi:hypothetical protein
MQDENNDTQIRVNIRTPTSTRMAGINRPVQVEPSQPQVTIQYSIIPILLDSSTEESDNSYLSAIFNYILNRSFEEKDELSRNPDIKLDIPVRESTIKDCTESCPICLNNFKQKEMVTTLNCKHTIHNVCIKEWGHYKQECPLCRDPIKVLEE